LTEVGVVFWRGHLHIGRLAMALSHIRTWRCSLEEINKQALKILGVVSEDIAFTRSVKYLHLAESGLTDSDIEKIRQIDEKTYETWKATTIYHMISAWPRPYRKMLKYNDWSGAMEELTKIYKKNSK
jgi:hypothetical protein